MKYWKQTIWIESSDKSRYCQENSMESKMTQQESSLTWGKVNLYSISEKNGYTYLNVNLQFFPRQ